MPRGKKSDAQRERVALQLARGRTVAGAAAACDVSERTVHNWIKDAAFARRVRELRAQLLRRTVARLADAGTKAVKALVDRMNAENEKGAVRVSAAARLLNSLFRGMPVVELEERIARLEGLNAGHDDGGLPP